MNPKLFCVFFSLIFSLSCQEEGPEVLEVPSVFRLGYHAPEENNEEKVTRLKAFAAYLEKKLEIPVELIEILHYAPAIEALKSNKLELTNLGSFGFVIAEEKAGVEPLAYRGHKDTGTGMYFSYCVSSHPEVNSMEDLKAKAKELKLTFGNPASTSGHLIPKRYLNELGISPSGFKEVLHSPDHVASLMAVLTRNVDIGVIQSSTYDKFLAKGKFSAEEVKLLYKSDPIQLGPYVIRPNLPEPFKAKVKKALLDLCVEEPEIWRGIRSTSDENIILLPAKPELWDEIRDMAREAKADMFH